MATEGHTVGDWACGWGEVLSPRAGYCYYYYYYYYYYSYDYYDYDYDDDCGAGAVPPEEDVVSDAHVLDRGLLRTATEGATQQVARPTLGPATVAVT